MIAAASSASSLSFLSLRLAVVTAAVVGGRISLPSVQSFVLSKPIRFHRSASAGAAAANFSTISNKLPYRPTVVPMVLPTNINTNTNTMETESNNNIHDNVNNNNNHFPFFQACPKCHGEGKLRKAPSRKTRHKRAKTQQQQQQQQQQQHDNDNSCNSTTTKQQQQREHQQQPITSPTIRLDPCPNCHSTGLVSSSSPFQTTTTTTTTTISNDSNCGGDIHLPHVAIVGGGLSGLAMGIACYHRSIPCTIFERDLHFYERSQGYGLTMQQATRALQALGITTDIQSSSSSSSLSLGITSTKHVVHTTDGTIVGEWGLRKWGRDITKGPPKRQNMHIGRQALRKELLNALENAVRGRVGNEQEKNDHDDCVKWGYRLVNITSDTTITATNDDGDPRQQVTLEFRVAGREDPVYFTKPNMIVVGADGIRSKVREFLIDNTRMPLRYLDCIVVLGICPLDNIHEEVRGNALLDGETVFQTADGMTRIYLMPYSNTSYMWQLSFPMKDEQEAKELSQLGAMALKEKALEKCHGWHSPIPEILSKTPVDLVSGYPVYDREMITVQDLASPLPITLLGDAAHPMSPFKGQGANQALLDALSLARSIVHAMRTQNRNNANTNDSNRTTISIALERYHEEMTTRSATKVRASAEAAKFLHTETAIQEGNITRGAAAAVAATVEATTTSSSSSGDASNV